MHFFKLSVFFSLFLFSSLVLSRTVKVDPYAKSIKGVRRCGSHSTKEQREASRKRFISDTLTPRSTYNMSSSEIKVYFHVIAANKTAEGGWVSDKQIERQMEVLNEDYNYTGISYKYINTTRTINKKWFEWVGSDDDLEASMKDKLRVGGPADMNVFTVGLIEGEFAGYLGFATMPENYEEYLQYDGILLNYASLPNGSLKKFDMGKTLTHEAGHWLGLYHTFDGECSEGDSVDDTPPEAEPAFGCPVGRDSCKGGERDAVHNFMNYGDDYCLTDFTQGQIKWMKEQIKTYRGIHV